MLNPITAARDCLSAAYSHVFAVFSTAINCYLFIRIPYSFLLIVGVGVVSVRACGQGIVNLFSGHWNCQSNINLALLVNDDRRLWLAIGRLWRAFVPRWDFQGDGASPAAPGVMQDTA